MKECNYVCKSRGQGQGGGGGGREIIESIKTTKSTQGVEMRKRH